MWGSSLLTGSRLRASRESSVLVIGLGRFGSSVVHSLSALGVEVLAADTDPELVRKHAGVATHAVVLDATDEDALAELDLASYQRGVVAIGTDIEASIITAANLIDLGLPDIWAKAINAQHGAVLEQLGVHHVVYPELAMGQRVAHVIGGSLVDFIEFEDGFAIARTLAPAEAWGKPLSESVLRTKYAVTVLGVRRDGHELSHAAPSLVVHQGDELIVAGLTAQVQQFAAQRH